MGRGGRGERGGRAEQRGVRAEKLSCVPPEWGTSVITPSPKPTGRTPPRVNPQVDRTWVTVTCQCRFIGCNKGPALARASIVGEAEGGGGAGGM